MAKSTIASRNKILTEQVEELKALLEKAKIHNEALHEENETVWFLIKELSESEQLTQDMLKHLEQIVAERKYTAMFAEKPRGTA